MDPIIALSRELIQKGSKSFALAAKLLPRSIRYDAMMLYAWCRHCDDVIDDQSLPKIKMPNRDGYAPLPEWKHGTPRPFTITPEH